MTGSAALALAQAHGIAVSLDGGDLILESRGAIPQEVRLAIRKAKADLVAFLARRDADQTGAVAGDELLEALRARGFVIRWRGDRGGTLPPLGDVVERRQAFFRRLLAWQAPSSLPVRTER
jgi:TubC N-terminal docking domain